ncbi:GroES-like protein [Pochonia chlamydosporia 170]|uniref:GroES-like protein n=1 Tax=Pochonia chlamydosporia 170 TaxID=1380566 RepID=A0A179FH09_METCM|nr:GroES-like protein [Pochonia chlamydosporia 170]OAQ64697.1 GroES-like protein [Pochonia chlamydosporia 170]
MAHIPSDLPSTFKGLQFTSASQPPSVVDLPTPQPTAGSVILKVVSAQIVSYAKEVYRNGNPRSYNYPLPLVPGTNAICRVAAPAPDTPHLKPGMLVYTSGVIRPRDNTTALPLLQGIHMGNTPESEALMSEEWRNGTWAELVKVPAENVHVLNEDALIKKLGYEVEDLGYISTLAVPYGGLSDVGLRPGETVIVAPASGSFSSAAVFVALAMGASKVIAMARNTDKLKRVVETAGDRVVTVTMSGNVETDTKALLEHGQADVYFDISPQNVTNPTYIQAAIMALRPHGRMSIMGGVFGTVELPYIMIMFKNITIKGTFMYTREQADELIRLVETGMLPIGKRGGIEVTGKYALSQWEEALENAFSQAGPKRLACFVPGN